MQEKRNCWNIRTYGCTYELKINENVKSVKKDEIRLRSKKSWVASTAILHRLNGQRIHERFVVNRVSMILDKGTKKENYVSTK